MIDLYVFSNDAFIKVQRLRNGVDITLDFYDSNGDLKPGVHTFEGLKVETLRRIEESYFSGDISQWIRIANELQISQNDIDSANAARIAVESNRAQHMESVVLTEPDGQQVTKTVSKDYYTYKNGYFTTWTYDGTISFADFGKNTDGTNRGIMDSSQAGIQTHELMRRGVRGGNIHRYARMFGLDPKGYIQPERVIAHFIYKHPLGFQPQDSGISNVDVNGNNIQVDFAPDVRPLANSYSVELGTNQDFEVDIKNTDKFKIKLLNPNGTPRKIKKGEELRLHVILDPSQENYE